MTPDDGTRRGYLWPGKSWNVSPACRVRLILETMVTVKRVAMMDRISELKDALRWLIHCLNKHQQYLPRVNDWESVAALNRQGERVLQYFIDDVSNTTRVVKDAQVILDVVAHRIIRPAPVRVGAVSRPSYSEAIVALANQVNAACRLYLAHSAPIIKSGGGDLPHDMITSGAVAMLEGYDWQDVENHMECELRGIDLNGLEFPGTQGSGPDDSKTVETPARVTLTPANLRTIFDIEDQETLHARMDGGLIIATKINTKKYSVQESCLPSDWRNRLNKALGKS